jgi:hypothetical protein
VTSGQEKVQPGGSSVRETRRPPAAIVNAACIDADVMERAAKRN